MLGVVACAGLVDYREPADERASVAVEIGFYTDDGARRVGSIVGDTCRPVEGVTGWLRVRQTHSGGFRSIRGTSRRALTARADVVLIDGAGFSGSPARYQAMLHGRAHRLEELRATSESLRLAMDRGASAARHAADALAQCDVR